MQSASVRKYLQNGSQSRQQVLDGRRHFVHANDVHDGFQRRKDGTKHFGVLFAQVLVQDDTEMAHQLLFLTSFHHNGDTTNQVGSLLTNLDSF